LTSGKLDRRVFEPKISTQDTPAKEKNACINLRFSRLFRVKSPYGTDWRTQTEWL